MKLIPHSTGDVIRDAKGAMPEVYGALIAAGDDPDAPLPDGSRVLVPVYAVRALMRAVNVLTEER